MNQDYKNWEEFVETANNGTCVQDLEKTLGPPEVQDHGANISWTARAWTRDKSCNSTVKSQG